MRSDNLGTNNSSTDVDIAVIGAGVVGMACALTLSQKGFKVLVVDKGPPGLGASYGNAGHMATEQVFPIADASILMRLPRMLLDPMGPLRLDWRHFPKAMPWFSRLLWNLRKTPFQNSIAGIRCLNESSLSAWRRLLKTISGTRLLKEEGSFLVYERSGLNEDIEALYFKMLAQNVPVEKWQGSAIRKIAPQLSDKIQGGLFFPETAHVANPHQLVTTLVKAAKSQNVQFEEAEITSGKVTNECVELLAGSRTISAKKVLIACGAHSGPLTYSLTGVKVPLDTERGYHLMLPKEHDRLPVAITSLERRFIMTPMDEGLRLAGTVEFAGLTQPPNMNRAWQLLRLSQGMFKTELNSEAATPWMGFRPSLPDSLPIIDSVQNDKVLLAFGHHHLGLTQAAITAEIISNLATQSSEGHISANNTHISLTPYKLARFT